MDKISINVVIVAEPNAVDKQKLIEAIQRTVTEFVRPLDPTAGIIIGPEINSQEDMDMVRFG